VLDLKFIRENSDLVEKRLKTRKKDISLKELLEMDEKRRNLQGMLDEKKSQRNTINKELPKSEDKKTLIEKMKKISEEIKESEKEEIELSNKIQQILWELPNIPHESVKISYNEEDAEILSTWGKIPEYDFELKDHVDLGIEKNILDFERAAKIAGSRFALYIDKGARLERALINFMLDVQTKEHGYKEFMTPYLVNADSLFTTSNLPKFEEDLFKTQDNLYLLPTSEVTLVNIHRDEILEENDLPLKYTAYTPCFRREAGSYGKDVRGLIRTHQFNKVELVQFTTPETSYEIQQKIVEHAEEILKRLGLSYRKIALVTSDISNASIKTIDIEVWVPTQGKYREVASISNCTDFQARRGNIKYRDKEGKLKFVHTLNGSGLATSRLLPAIIETYQKKDGSIEIPEVLRKYTGFDAI